MQTHGAPRQALRGRKVDALVHADGRVELIAGREVLPSKVLDPARDVPSPVDDKTLNARVDEILGKPHRKKAWHPGPDHPWRRSFITTPSSTNRTSLSCPKTDISTLP